MSSLQGYTSLKHESDRVVCFERGGCVFVLNFHHEKSFDEYKVGVEVPGKYVVTGDREAVAVLTIYPADASGNRRWQLDDGVKLYDVTHLPCRSARYTPIASSGTCTPAKAPLAAFQVPPGAEMPAVAGCHKQDYSVLFIIGVAVGQ